MYGLGMFHCDNYMQSVWPHNVFLSAWSYIAIDRRACCFCCRGECGVEYSRLVNVDKLHDFCRGVAQRGRAVPPSAASNITPRLLSSTDTGRLDCNSMQKAGHTKKWIQVGYL